MSSVMLVLIRPPASWGRRRDCLLFWLAVATTFDGLNAVDSRSGEFKMAQIQKIDRVRVPRGHRERPALRRRFSGSSAMRLQSIIGNTALIIESEMFGGRRTLRQ